MKGQRERRIVLTVRRCRGTGESGTAASEPRFHAPRRRTTTNRRKPTTLKLPMNIDSAFPLVTCVGCGQEKGITQFRVMCFVRDLLRKKCRTCVNEDQRRWHERNVEAKQKFHLKYTFGITAEQYAAMLSEQGGVCAICKERETFTRNGKRRQLCVDHCHSTGRNRGLLCGKCNVALGYFLDSQELLQSAIAYLSRHQQPTEEINHAVN